MEVRKLAAFSHNNQGGNPAGVVICNEMPTEETMLQTAKHVGYSVTAFLKQMNDSWKNMYERKNSHGKQHNGGQVKKSG